LFTDIEDFTRHCSENEAGALASLRWHDALVRDAIETRGGTVFKTVGDAFCAAFVSPDTALQAAIAVQERLIGESWGLSGGPSHLARNSHRFRFRGCVLAPSCYPVGISFRVSSRVFGNASFAHRLHTVSMQRSGGDTGFLYSLRLLQRKRFTFATEAIWRLYRE
ncbi:MAG: hypothetical protein H7Z41_10330, partial [Cytophagales bacterium]|nr:hypothetical protein [Armatimonadota bacterium]